jgi:amino acid adenylation domain-containing protein/natural product biosynthesis luciferase-like monooxygenase protein
MSKNEPTFDPRTLTIAQRLKLLERMRAQQGEPQEPALAPCDRTQPLALSHAQQRLWFLARLEPRASAAYHICAALRLVGTLDRSALQAALDTIVRRHESLRTTFEEVDGSPMQRIGVPQTFELVLHDLQGHPDAAAEVERLSDVAAHAPFDLARGPLIRGRLIALGEHEHVLLLSMHHIVSDGWSLGVLTREIGMLYEACRAGRPDPLPPLALQYADYAQWQRRREQGPQRQAQLAYWREQLKDAPPRLELPTDRPRPAVQDYAGARIDFTLDAGLARAMKALSERHGTTLYMTFLAGWAALLHRLSGQRELVIGSAVAGRSRTELEPLIGVFLNTLALRIDFSSGPTVAELLAQVKGTALAAQGHQDVPFDQVVEVLNPVRSLSHTPLFQTMFDWHAAPETMRLPGLSLEPLSPDQVTTQFDLSMAVGPDGAGIGGSIEFATALFDRPTVERWLRHWYTFLAAMAQDDAQPVSRLPLLDQSERYRLLQGGQGEHAGPLRASWVHQEFEAQVRRAPEAIALVHEGESLSYAELNRRANRLAHALIGRGVRPDAHVAIGLPRSVDTVVAVLAVLKSGGAYVPLDPAAPPDRLAGLLEDSAPQVLITRRSVWPSMQFGLVVIDLDEAALPGHDTDPDPFALGLSSRHLAYVIYTSGSTGRPKGVMVEHGSLCHQIAAVQGCYELTAHDRVLQFAPFTFDVCAEEIFGALCSGATLVLRTDAWVADAQRFWTLCEGQGITVVDLPVAYWQLLAGDVQARIPESLRLVVIGGEAASDEAVRRWHQREGWRPVLLNAYGPTETTINATVHRVKPGSRGACIGRPLAHVRVYVLDGRLQPVPVGVPGELCIGGAGVARGYLNEPELTARCFVSDPFVPEPARMYRSGDLARWRDDGTLEFLGRNDFQVKVRGFRVEPGEIEARLRSCVGVRAAVVLAREESPGDARLVAYYLADSPLDAQMLRSELAQHLPEYMLPVAWVHLPAWPLTAHGKLDRQGLPAPQESGHERPGDVEPQGEIETAIAQLWSELLGIERVGRHDDFFDLGGHSLLAVQLVARLRHTLGREVEVGELFAHPVLAGFAQVVAEAAACELPPIAIVDRHGPLPLSFAQQRLWFLAQLEDQASAAYHMAAALKLVGELDHRALQAALDRVIERHEALRTSFVSVDGSPVQRIHEAEPFTLVIHDLSAHPEAARELQRLVDDEADAPFDLPRGPLIRGRLIALGAHEHVLALTMHHIVSDAWSQGRLIHELGALYRAYREHLPDPLPPLAIQYADYAQWQRRWARGPQMQAQLDYWREHLRGAPALLDLPADRPRPPAQDYAGGRYDFTLDPALTPALKALSARHGTTLYMTLLAAWAALLYRLSGQDDLVIGSPVAGRTRTELEPLIGFFLNTLALRIRLDGAASVSDLLMQVKQIAVAAQAHQDLPFEQLVDALNPVRSLAHSPLFQTMFAWQNAPEPRLSFPGLEIQPLTSSQVTARFDLFLSLAENGPLIDGCIEYASSLFDRSTLVRYVKHWQVMLAAMAADDAQPIAGLPLLTEPQRRKLLVDWNDTQAAYPRDRCLHHVFEAQAEQSPDAVAVRQGAESLTYAELNARANRLAHHLIVLGVVPDTRVAIAMRRRPAMLVGLLAILKAGGAYVPIDPAYPAPRLAYLLADAAPQVLLTEASLAQDWTAHPNAPRIVHLDTDVRLWSQQPVHNPRAPVTAHDLAYVMYTSGSTGEPKGVMVNHRSVVNLLWSIRRMIDMHPGDRLLALTTLTFDIAALELYGPLVCGAEVVLADRETVLDPRRLARCIDDHRITVMQATPGVWRTLLDSGWSGDAHLKALVGGEALPHELAQRLRASTAALWNVYGPTETTIWSTAQAVGPVGNDRDDPRPPPIGHPLANTRVYILDAHGQPTPVGVLGEIHIAGDGVARGYLNRPEVTRERFVPDPFSPDPPGARMYRTGDLGRWRADGTIEYHGRNDFEVKVRGIRIHPAEIESALAHHPGVSAAAVVAREHGPGDSRLVAYVVPQAADDTASSDDAPPISFSLFYFGAGVPDPANKYGLYLESAQYADRHGFEAVWTPERHFHAVGGLYANPSVLSAALATVTQRIHLRSGSVVLPLHHPVRVAEEWAMVDNLSQGRVGLSVASGWHPRDFVFNPDAYASRRPAMFEGIEVLRALWRGESVALRDGEGAVSDIRIHPQPLQKELPLWVTAAGNPDTFIQAGKLGANVLTHLLGQSMADLAGQIVRYRQARLEAGHDPEAGRVTLMVHTYVGDDAEQALQQAKGPFMRYLMEHFGLTSLEQQFKHTAAAQAAQDLESMAEVAFEHYSQTASLIGTPQSCLALVQEAKRIGVDELACLSDWMDAPRMMSGLEPLNRLRQLARRTQPSARDVRRFLAARLPDHLVPSTVVFIDALPMTDNGKLDRKALPAPKDDGAPVHRYEAPVGDTEMAIARLWAELVGVARVGRHDNFFELGGNSLMVVTMLERLRQDGMPAEVRTLFAHPTPALLAQAIAAQAAQAGGEGSSETIELTL